MNEALWSAMGTGVLFGVSGGFSPGPLSVLVIFIAGALFLTRIGWLSLITSGFDPGIGKVKLHTLLKRIMTNYLNPSMYLFWFTVSVSFILKSGKVFRGSPALFMLSFFASIFGAQITFAVIAGHSREFLQGFWYRRIMQFLGLSLIGYALLLIKEALAIIGVV